MQNLGCLACSVWAVGSKMLLDILYSEETCTWNEVRVSVIKADLVITYRRQPYLSSLFLRASKREIADSCRGSQGTPSLPSEVRYNFRGSHSLRLYFHNQIWKTLNFFLSRFPFSYLYFLFCPWQMICQGLWDSSFV